MHETHGANVERRVRKMKQNVIYYSDPLNDDFAGTEIKRKPPRKNFKYVHTNPFWKFSAFILYQGLVRPFSHLYRKIVYKSRIYGREKIKDTKGGCYVYANHTAKFMDAIHPACCVAPKKAYILVNPDATSIPFISGIVQQLGGVPLYEELKQRKECMKALDVYTKKDAVFIYPEAHIWPCCTWIRPFTDRSFRYPVKGNLPTFSCTTVLKKRKFTSLPKIDYYIDGPFYGEGNTPKEIQLDLRNKVYEMMVERSKESNYDRYLYLKKAE